MFAQHLLENKHFIRSTENIMTILQIIKNGSIINISVKFVIYDETKFTIETIVYGKV